MDSLNEKPTAIPQTIIEEINGVKIEMVLVKGSSFLMGLQSEDKQAANYVPPTFYDFGLNRSSDFFTLMYPTFPVHLVYVPDFYIGKYPVTQAQWKAVMGQPSLDEKFVNFYNMMKKLNLETVHSNEWDSFITHNRSYFVGDDLPIENVSLFDIQYFLKKLRHQTNKRYRLPIEAEWEFAAGNGIYRNPNLLNLHSFPDNYTWEDALCTHSVYEGIPNQLGLYSMLDNVYEWCQDAAGMYPVGLQHNNTPFSMQNVYIVRGSAFENLSPNDLNYFIFARFCYSPHVTDIFTGFRLALTIN